VASGAGGEQMQHISGSERLELARSSSEWLALIWPLTGPTDEKIRAHTHTHTHTRTEREVNLTLICRSLPVRERKTTVKKCEIAGVSDVTIYDLVTNQINVWSSTSGSLSEGVSGGGAHLHIHRTAHTNEARVSSYIQDILNC